MEQTLEEKTANTILQKSREVRIGDKTYTAAQPSTATLILVSEAVSHLPKVKLNDKDIASECLSIAKDCRLLGDIAAILILGARHITETVRTPHTDEKRLFWGLIRYKQTVIREQTIDRKGALAKEILEELSPLELHSLIGNLLSGMDLADFFALTTFLTEINLLRQTKVETGTTASGQ